MVNKIIIIFISLLILFVYTKMNKSYKLDNDRDDYKMVKKYLLNDNIENIENNINNKLPILWILLEHNPNARNWLSFGSRLTNNLNQPYMYNTIKSIINKCNKSFNICVIDDESIKTIIPEWNVNMKILSEPIKSKMRELAKANILNKYGGMFVPASFICFKDLIHIYNNMTNDNKMFVGEFINNTISSENLQYLPDSKIIGSNKNNELLNNYIKYLEHNISNDYTSESIFKGDNNNWLNNNVKNEKINLLKSELIGVKDFKNNPVTINDLFSNNYVEFNPNFYGVYIPNNEIIKRNNYNWFSKLSKDKSFKVDNLLGTLLRVSCDI